MLNPYRWLKPPAILSIPSGDNRKPRPFPTPRYKRIPIFSPPLFNPEDRDFNLQVKALMTIWRYSHSPGFQDGLRRAFQLIRQIDPEVKMRDFLFLMASYLHSVRKDF